MILWYKIIQFFQDYKERNSVILGFNKASRDAFIEGIIPVMLEASISKGDSKYKHQYSKWLRSGFRIKAFSGKQLNQQNLLDLGKTIIDDSVLVRRLVVLGFDTLEIHCDIGTYGCKWQLKDYLALK